MPRTKQRLSGRVAAYEVGDLHRSDSVRWLGFGAVPQQADSSGWPQAKPGEIAHVCTNMHCLPICLDAQTTDNKTLYAEWGTLCPGSICLIFWERYAKFWEQELKLDLFIAYMLS